jgi:hypothetical protein
MKHLKKFNENISIFDSNWVKLLPKKLTIITQNGEFTLDVKSLEPEDDGYSGIYNLMNCICVSYVQNTLERENNDPTADGEPDNLQFDITIVKDNKGDEANPKNSLRLNIDLTYGDSMVYAFTIDYPNKVNVHHYNGKDSLYDAGTFFGFSDESLQGLVTFFNRFGFTTTVKDFKFIDDDPDSYDYERPTEKYLKDPGTKGNKLIPMIMDDDMKSKVDDIKGGDKIIRYNEFKASKKF